MAGGLGMTASELLALEENLSPKAERRSSLEPSFDDALVEERHLRYLRVPQLFAAKQTKLWAARVERGAFGEEEFRKGVDAFLDFEEAFVQGVGTDLLAALREDEDALPKAEREAFDTARTSIDAWYRILWKASYVLQARGAANVVELDSVRKRMEAWEPGTFARSGEADEQEAAAALDEQRRRQMNA